MIAQLVWTPRHCCWGSVLWVHYYSCCMYHDISSTRRHAALLFTSRFCVGTIWRQRLFCSELLIMWLLWGQLLFEGSIYMYSKIKIWYVKTEHSEVWSMVQKDSWSQMTELYSQDDQRWQWNCAQFMVYQVILVGWQLRMYFYKLLPLGIILSSWNSYLLYTNHCLSHTSFIQ